MELAHYWVTQENCQYRKSKYVTFVFCVWRGKMQDDVSTLSEEILSEYFRSLILENAKNWLQRLHF